MKKVQVPYGWLLIFAITMVVQQSGCVQKIRPTTGLKPGIWYVSEELQVAMKFLDEGTTTQGEYIPLGSALANKLPFQVKSRRQGHKFIFSGHPQLNVKGELELTTSGYVLHISKDRKANLVAITADTLPWSPGRYAAPIFSKILRTERIFGYAPGYYSSKPVADMSPQAYPKIVLDVLTDVTLNLFRDSVKLDMDIYYAENDNMQNRPLIVMIHGGAFVVGDKRSELARRLSTYYAQCGYVVASINYRMGYPAIPGVHSQLERAIFRGVQDVRAALRYLSFHQKEFNIDPQQVFLMGNSAGGFYSLLTAFKEENEKWESSGGYFFGLRKELGCLDCSGNQYKAQYSIAGVVNMWGGIPDLELIDKHEQIPALLIHGTADRIVAYGYDYPFRQIDPRLSAFFTRRMYGSKPIHDHMQQLGMDVKLITIPNGHHEPQDDDTAVFEMIRSEIRTFMHRVQGGVPLRITGPATPKPTDPRTVYTVLNHNELPVRWQVNGGIITQRGKNWIEVVWIAGETKKFITAATINHRGLVQSDRLMVVD